MRWPAGFRYRPSPLCDARKMPSGEASHIARKRTSAACSAPSTRLRSTVRATPCATSCSRSGVALLPGRADGGGEAGDADQHAVHDHRHQRQRAIAVGRDQLLDGRAQKLVRARHPHHAAAAQAGQERLRQDLQRHARELGQAFMARRWAACHSWVSASAPAFSSSS